MAQDQLPLALALVLAVASTLINLRVVVRWARADQARRAFVSDVLPSMIHLAATWATAILVFTSLGRGDKMNSDLVVLAVVVPGLFVSGLVWSFPSSHHAPGLRARERLTGILMMAGSAILLTGYLLRHLLP